MCPFPNDEQRRVIEHRGRPLVVVAGPGTGKTQTIVQRMIDLVKENPDRVVSFITFTRASRRDAEAKLREQVGRQAVQMAEEDFPRVSTLHRFAKAIVHRCAPALGREANFSVLAPKQREKAIVLSETLEDVNAAVDCAVLEHAIARFRSTGEWPADPTLSESQWAPMMGAFEFLLRFYNTFDMEGLVAKACDLLCQGTPKLPPVFLQVDEYQDLNPMDQRLVRLIGAAPGSEVVVVGDDAQSIYTGLRYAHPAGIRELWASQDWARECFPDSHRLPCHVLRAAQSLVRGEGYLGAALRVPEGTGRPLRTLRCTRRTTGTKPPIQVEAVAHLIRSLLGTPKRADGSPAGFRDMMILCPIHTQVDQAADALEQTYGIPTKQERSGGIPDEVWKLVLVLRMLGEHDSLALRQWLPEVGLSAPEVRRTRTAAIQAGQSLYQYCSGLADGRIANIFVSLAVANQALVDALQFRDALRRFPGLPLTPDVTTAVDEIVEHIPAVGRMISRLYEKYGLLDSEGEEGDISLEDRVLVTTMHGAKGLEAEFIFIMWLNSRFMPMPGRDRDEEERVLYVALTRARQDVVLTFEEGRDPQTGCYLRDEAMSPFLWSIRDHLHIQPVTASTVSSICSR